jgi:hypothetical protein
MIAILNQTDNLTPVIDLEEKLPRKAWYIARCGGDLSVGDREQGCGKLFNIITARHEGEFVICPHCGTRS